MTTAQPPAATDQPAVVLNLKGMVPRELGRCGCERSAITAVRQFRRLEKRFADVIGLRSKPG